MPGSAVKIYYLASSPTALDRELKRFRKEIDGISIIISGSLSEGLIEALSRVRSEELRKLLVFEEFNEAMRSEILKFLRGIEPYAVAFHNLGVIRELRKDLEGLRIVLGTVVRNPFPNFSALKKIGINLVIMPTALIKGRVVKEAKASGLELIAYLVNDPATYLKMKSSGVAGIITKNPGIAREAEKLKL